MRFFRKKEIGLFENSGEKRVEKELNAKRLMQAVISVGFITIAAKVCAFIQEITIASFVGTSELADAYYMTNSIMQILWSFLSLGISRVFLPEYKKCSVLEGEKSAEKYANNMLSIMALIALFLSAVIFLFAPLIVKVFAFGFSDEAKRLSTVFSRIRTPQYVFWCIITIISAMLQANGRFSGSKIHLIAVHIPTIILTIVLYEKLGIYAVLSGVLLGSVVGLLSQIPFLNWGHRFKFRIELTNHVKESFQRIPAAFVSAGINQIHSFVDKAMGSMQPIGAISSLSYGGELYRAVEGLISGTFATVSYPRIVELISTNDKERLSDYLTRILKVTWMLSIPFSIAFFIYSDQIVTVIYERGKFDESSTALVASIFSLYSIGLFFSGTTDIVNLVFLGYGDTKTPMYASLIGIALNVLFNFIFVHFYGTAGLALASSIATMFIFCFTVIRLKEIVEVFNRRLLMWLGKIMIYAGIACCGSFLPFYIQIHTHLLFKLFISGVIGIILYLVLLFLFVPADIKVFMRIKKNDKTS